MAAPGEWRVEMEYNLSQLALRIAFKAPQKPFLVASSLPVSAPKQSK